MYRLLGAQRNYAARVCLFCNYCHGDLAAVAAVSKPFDHSQLRHCNSTVNTNILSSVGKRKQKKRTKKYAELLEVTDSVTSNRKAAVQNLNAAQFSILVDQPDITLDKLHKIKEKTSTRTTKNEKNSFSTASSESSTRNQFPSASSTDFSELSDTFGSTTITATKDHDKFTRSDMDEEELLAEDLDGSNIVDNTVLIKTASLVETISDNSDIQEIVQDDAIRIEESEQSDYLKESIEIIEKERKAKEAIIHKEKLKQFNKAFLAYVNVCVNSGHTMQYNKLILKKYKRRKAGQLYVDDISVYNVVIEQLASNSNLNAILNILQDLKKTEINLNTQTYSHIFECIGRMECDNKRKLELLYKFKEEMMKDGISLNDVITKSKFVRDQKSYIEKMVKLIDDKFEPAYELPDTRYDCTLLDGLTEETATPSSTIGGLLTIDDFKERLQKQIQMEINGQIAVQNIVKQNTPSSNITYLRNKLSNLEKTWEKVALSSFKRNLTTLRNHEKMKYHSFNLFPYLSILRPEDYVSIIMKEVQKLGMGSEMFSLPFNSLCAQLGTQVYKMYEAKLKQSNGINDKTSSVYLQYCDWLINRNDKANCRIKWTILEHEANKHGVTLGVDVPQWPRFIHLHVGKFLFDIIINDFKVNTNFFKKKEDHPAHYSSAFFKIFRHSGVKLKEEVKPHPIIAKLYRDSEPPMLTFDTTLVPSLCPPRPWVSVNDGGYIVTQTNITRVTHFGNQQWDRLVSAPLRKLYPAFDSLNQLGSIPWTVNSAVLDVILEVFRNNGSVELNVPQPPSVLSPIPPTPKDADSKEKKTVEKERIELKRKKNEMYSLWCDALYRLSLANHFRNDIFWLPHNMDFRGRVYPVPPHLNHLGNDLARSILIFALKKPLGSRGLDWLKIHCINLTGFKKRDSIRERLKYANEIMDKIIDSAEKPLTGQMWWAKSDEPWQTLATCMEIAAALKCPNPEEFMTGFPVHQDGSCNGLQHYAALGRDQIGGESVNLCPSEIPQDVYSSVAAMVDEKRKEDAAKGNKIAQILEGFIKRKVIKQTVMTTVYGVTWFGAKLQIARQLKDLNDFPQEHVWPASIYLVQKTFQTLRTMFKSAREIQDWLTHCAGLICITRDQNMEWVTPLGLPVVQSYSKVHKPLRAQSSVFSPDIYRKPNVMKHRNAFPPNFVHSLDSSHMMLTSIQSERAGITFVSVHDCYWTHPCTVEIMNKICREQFVALHSEPILDDLSKFLMDKFGYKDLLASEKSNKRHILKEKLNDTLSTVPKQGDFDLKSVLNSTYFFS